MASTAAVKEQGHRLQVTVNGAIDVTVNVKIILEQPDVTIDKLPNFPAQLEKARTHAKVWMDDIIPQITLTIKDVTDYAEAFADAYKQLLGLVESLEKGSAKEKFTSIINDVLVSRLKKSLTNATKIAKDIGTFHDSFLPDYSNFQKDFQVIKGIVNETNNEIESLKTKKAQTEALAQQLLQMSTEMPENPGLEAGYYSQFIAAKEEADKIGKQIDEKQSYVNKLTKVETEINTMEKSSMDVMNASASVRNGWQTLIDDMNEFMKRIEAISPQQIAIIIKSELGAAAKDWQDVLEMAQKLSLHVNYLLFPPRTFQL